MLLRPNPPLFRHTSNPDVQIFLFLLQILFGRMVGFITGDIVGNLIAIIQQLGDGGLVGLIAIGIILWLFQRRTAM